MPFTLNWVTNPANTIVYILKGDVPASYVVAWAVILQVLDLRPLVTMTANSYMVLGLRPVTVWLRAVVSAD
ncbi:hypothetical protein GOODEAATRI_032557 [Goodea atripinnis]|uniref:Uncharacterized protein n=1 Tax=Goodea atripinnis TaxID=208336 RepID=A0ABV0P9J0_9TELE